MCRRVRQVAAILFLFAGLCGCGPTLREVTVTVNLPPGITNCKTPIQVMVGNRTYEITTDADIPLGMALP